MSETSERMPFTNVMPASAEPAVRVVTRLRDAGHAALLNGGCVRDLLLGATPKDYDVATDATPERVCALFRSTRKVGAQFGVVLVRLGKAWIEVATFREDGDYSDGRRPDKVCFSDARHDAQRRDFTINGMFLDPLEAVLIDYVGGRADLERRVVRSIGDPAQRFAEDHLRLLRAVRFAARLGFEIEPRTLAAIRTLADKLPGVAAERRREELEKMLAHPTRARALALLRDAKLLDELSAKLRFSQERYARAAELLTRLPDEAPFALAWAALVADRDAGKNEAVCRELTFSNEDRGTVHWLVRNQAALDEPLRPSLAALKRLLALREFGLLRMLAEARYQDSTDAKERSTVLAERIAGIPAEAIEPAPLVTGDDLAARQVPPGPIYKEVLDELYERQLNEQLDDRAAALAALDALLAARGRANDG